jgi:ferredoxin-thioredoxin reductase catalytic subunit
LVSLHAYIEIHGQQNIKFSSYVVGKDGNIIWDFFRNFMEGLQKTRENHGSLCPCRGGKLPASEYKEETLFPYSSDTVTMALIATSILN